MVQIPILSEKAAGRHPGAIGPDDIESFIAMPLQAAPRGAGAYTGFIVRGDAMKPTLCDRFIAVIDHANRDAAGLPGRVVALLVDGVVMVRRLIGQMSSGDLLLRADNKAYPDITLELRSSNPILGDVVFWWGTQQPAEPPES